MQKPISTLGVALGALALCAAGYALGSLSQNAEGSKAAKSPSHHDHLKLDEGVWDAAVKITVDPATEPMVMKGTVTSTMACDGKWLVEDFESDSFQGHGIAGWDPQKKKYVSVWVDGESPSIQFGEGTCSADGKTRTMNVETTDAEGKLVKMREVHAVTGPDARTMTIYQQGTDGKESVVLAIEYKRRH